MTKSKKMLALVIALVVMLVAVSGTLIAVLVAGNQNAQSKVHVKYTSSDVNVKVEAKYYVGSTGTDMVDKSNSNAKSIELDANKSTGSLDQPSNDAVELSKTNNKIIYEYKFTNLSTTIPATIGQLVEDGSVVVPKDSNNNVKLTYTSSSTSLGSGATSDATTLNTQGLPASSTRYVYVIVSIVELLNDVDFEGTFGWDLAKGTTASLDTTGSGNSIVNVNTSQTGFYNAAALQNIDLMIGVENQEPAIYPMIANKCFTGWYTNSALTTKAVFPMVITADTKLYPKHETATSDLGYTYNSTTKTYRVEDGEQFAFAGYKGTATEIVIADVYDDNTNDKAIVEKIGSAAFFGCSSLTSITIPKSVTTICTAAFYGCHGLVNVAIPDGVIYIQQEAFCDCDGLIELTISNSITTIGTFAFSGCRGLTNITIPNSVTTIEDGAFFNCSGLTGIIIPDSVLGINSAVFQGCTSLTSITIGSGVQYIWADAFAQCSSLTNAIFKVTNGWSMVSLDGKESIDVSETNLSYNANLLTSPWGYQLIRS